MKCVAVYSYSLHEWFDRDRKVISIGGAEYQLYTLVKKLSSRGFEMVILSGEGTFSDNAVYDGIRCIRVFSSLNKNVLTKLFFLMRALVRSRADVFIERGSSDMAFWLGVYCFLARKKYIFCGASDINFALDAVDPSLKRSHRLYRLGLKLANVLVAQKKSQQALILENYRRKSIHIANFPPPVTRSPQLKTFDVVWVSNIIPYKKPEYVMELARRLSHRSFVMVGGARDPNYYEIISKDAEKIPNLTFLGYQPMEAVNDIINISRLITNTTQVEGRYEEGFPNSFLQAWQMGVPVVSLISDPDGILLKFGIGVRSGSLEKMASDIEELLLNETLRYQMGERGKEYVRIYHDESKILNQYYELCASR